MHSKLKPNGQPGLHAATNSTVTLRRVLKKDCRTVLDYLHVVHAAYFLCRLLMRKMSEHGEHVRRKVELKYVLMLWSSVHMPIIQRLYVVYADEGPEAVACTSVNLFDLLRTSEYPELNLFWPSRSHVVTANAHLNYQPHAHHHSPRAWMVVQL
ncbi:hypothetical protein JOM56_001520 [Amanita muscaria]